MRRCEDEKVRYRPPLLEEPCAQTLSGKSMESKTHCKHGPASGRTNRFLESPGAFSMKRLLKTSLNEQLGTIIDQKNIKRSHTIRRGLCVIYHGIPHGPSWLLENQPGDSPRLLENPSEQLQQPTHILQRAPVGIQKTV